jgi:segregation and condensation protein A
MSDAVMSETPAFEETDDPPKKSEIDFQLDLEGYGGPIDALLQLARDQKVDLTHISILALADQYLDFVSRARRLRLELAADYLVMAAWLAYLKSRLLLPEPRQDGDEPSGAEMAAALKFQLQRLQAMQDAGSKLLALPRLGRDKFPRGEPAPLRVVNNVTHQGTLYDLLKAYGRSRQGAVDVANLVLDPGDLYSVDDALQRLGKMLGAAPGWQVLTGFLPAGLRSGLRFRSSVAATFAATLEMVRAGKVMIRQDGHFQPIYVRGQTEPSEGSHE